jgi:hypothetical protein
MAFPGNVISRLIRDKGIKKILFSPLILVSQNLQGYLVIAELNNPLLSLPSLKSTVRQIQEKLMISIGNV